MSEPTPVIPQSTVEYYAPMPVLLAPRRRQRYWLHAVLLLATFFTTLVVGSHFQYNFEQQRPALADEEDSYSFLSFLSTDLASSLAPVAGDPFWPA